jgi:hypothetical protein
VEPYDYALGAEAVHVFTAFGARRREQLLQHFAGLAANPFESGDYQEPGQAGRSYQVRLVDDLLITWWVDHAAREVRVLRIEET